MLGIAEGRCFRIGFAARLAGVGVLEDVQTLRVSGHQSVFDSVVDHLDEMPRAGRAAMQITFFGGAAGFFAARSALRIATSWSQCFEDGIEMFDDIRFATDHLAV